MEEESSSNASCESDTWDLAYEYVNLNDLMHLISDKFAHFSRPEIRDRNQYLQFNNSTLFDLAAQNILANRALFNNLFECTGANLFLRLRMYIIMHYF